MLLLNFAFFSLQQEPIKHKSSIVSTNYINNKSRLDFITMFYFFNSNKKTKGKKALTRVLLSLLLIVNFAGQGFAATVMPYQMLGMQGMMMQHQGAEDGVIKRYENNVENLGQEIDHSAHHMPSLSMVNTKTNNEPNDSSFNEETKQATHAEMDCCADQSKCSLTHCLLLVALLENDLELITDTFTAKINTFTNPALIQPLTSLYKPPIAS